jgi:CubicO group peptidase (beta-lactamase class C family)
MDSFDDRLPDLLAERMANHVACDETAGIAWLAMRGDDIVVGSAGALDREGGPALGRDGVFRIASMTKPITAVAALILVEECRLRLDEPVHDLLPELIEPRVLLDPRGPMDGDTVPAERPITTRDILTNRMGWGMDFTAPWPQPLLDAMGGLGLAPAAPEPQLSPAPDEWMARMATLPLIDQPGERWLYNTASDVLGVLVERAAGMPFPQFVTERVLRPLGMADTGFSVDALSAGAAARMTTSYAVDPEAGERSAYDTADGQWATPPAFASGAGGLLSTVGDFARFGRMLLADGVAPDGTRLLGHASIAAMTTDQLGVAAGSSPAIDPLGATGWGFGVGVHLRRTGPARSIGTYGWDGGLGSSWANDPAEGLIGVVMSTDMFSGPDSLPRPLEDFWTTVYANLGGR